MEKTINYIELVTDFCKGRLEECGVSTITEYQSRFKQELKDLQDWFDYGNVNMAKRLWELKENKRHFETNSSGSLLLFLLGITNLNPIKEKIQTQIESIVVGDCPDIDTDFDPRYRPWVKQKIVELFKEENTCSIGTCTTYKTKAVIVDVSRALGLDVNLVMDVTKQMNSLQKHEDEDGVEEIIDQMDWEDVFELYPDLKSYMESNPDVLRHCKVLRNQVKNLGKHAGGMIISNINLQDKIPVYRDKSGMVISTWMEGQAEHSLSEVGLIKFDLLGLSNLSVIADCIKLIEKTRGHKLTRATIPINDRDAIKFCSSPDLVGIFQFESAGTKPIADSVKMDSIDDISAVTSLIRPGPRNCGLDSEYALRKHGKEYHLPECLKPVLGDTFGILTYQEQCIFYDTMIYTTRGYEKIGKLVEEKIPTDVYCFNDEGDMVVRPVEQFHDNGIQELYCVTLSNGKTIKCTEDERFLVEGKGWTPLQYINPEDNIITEDDFI